MASNKNPQPDKIVGDVLASIKRFPRDVAVFVGFIEETTSGNEYRLYLSAQFDEFIEFAKISLVHSVQLPAAQYPLGGTVVWIDAGARVTVTRLGYAESASAALQVQQAQFLQGTLTTMTGTLGAAGSSGNLNNQCQGAPSSGGGCSGLAWCGTGPGSGGGCSGYSWCHI